MAWYVAPSLAVLRSEINTRWPNRDKRSDGTIGDRFHKPPSDHLENSRGSVNAFDWDRDGVNPNEIIKACINHPSTNYVIFNEVIWSRKYDFKPRRYTGSNKHTKHGHTSILQTKAAEQNRQPWGLLEGISMLPLRHGAKNEDVGYFQVKLARLGFYTGKIDNWYWDETAKAVLACRKSIGSNARSGKKIGRHAAEQIDRVHANWAAPEGSSTGGLNLNQVISLIESAGIKVPAK